MQAIERLNYRVTVGDVAAQAGLDLNLAQQGLLTLASESGGHLQVAESGDIVYLFAKDFRNTLRNKFFVIRLKESWQRVWRVVFYIIRISFGIVLIGLIVAAIVAIIVLALAAQSSRDNDDRGDWGGSDLDRGWGGGWMSYWWNPNIFWLFDWNSGDGRRPTTRLDNARQTAAQLSFLESIFSFLFGDGDPNADRAEQQWRMIGAIIRDHQGAIIAEQVAPFLDEVGDNPENEDYILPVLLRFDGQPEVSPEGQIIYHFPQLQTTVAAQQQTAVPSYLPEKLWRFSQATSGQITAAIGLGIVLFILGIVLYQMVIAIGGGGTVLIQAIAVLALVYSIAYLTIPTVRYFWLQWRNRKIAARNQQRQQRVAWLDQASAVIQHKLAFAKQFATEKRIRPQDLVYTTEEDLITQQLEQSPKLGEEWDKQLRQRHPDSQYPNI
jgi:hypothetical protein